jgi:hypothetical protein
MKRESAIPLTEHNKIDLEIETVKAQNVSLSVQLSRDQETEKSITTIITAKRELVKYFYLPIVFKRDEYSYEIIARAWAYSFWVDSLAPEFPCLVVHDRSSVAKIIELGERETDMLLKYLTGTSSEKPSRATETRHKAISSGQTCPFCHGTLRQSRRKNNTEGVGTTISCENKSNHKINDGKGCDFEAVLAGEEIKLFEDYRFPTSMWLKPAGKQCPVCGDQIFMRIVHRDGKQEFYERCRGYYRKENKCTHKKRMEVPIS